jgi:glutamate synthase (NADPH) large chain
MKHIKKNLPQEGLYVPQFESDACGTGFIANLNGIKSHQLVTDGLTMLANMHHRGASGCEENTGDGAGLLLQIPHIFFEKEAIKLGFDLGKAGSYAVGMLFFPKDEDMRENCRLLLNDYADELGFDVLGYRLVPVNNSEIGDSAKNSEPCMEQVFIRPRQRMERRSMERRLFVLRKFAHHTIYATLPQSADDFYICSLSCSTIIYKGQLTARQVRHYFIDTQNPDFQSAIAVIHSRFSTNTVPKWKLAQPFRYIAHNGEINTIEGNIRWWESKEPLLSSQFFTDDELQKLKPICGVGLSDSGVFDNVLEFLTLAGRSLPHSMMMMIPEAWQHDPLMEDYKKAFYEYHSMLMEPWDGPASMCFTDGYLVGATLDRNGLRPSRYCLLEDNTLIVASEAGALPVNQSKVVAKGRLQPGKMLIADLDEHRIIADEEVKKIICKRFPYRDWLADNTYTLGELPYTKDKPDPATNAHQQAQELDLLHQQRVFGYSREDLYAMLLPAAEMSDEPLGSMGTDTPLAILSNRSQHLANYFKQLFAQVTNPPIDPIRERSVMALFSPLGGTVNPLDLDREHPRSIHLETPVLHNSELTKLKNLHHPHFKAGFLDSVFAADGQKGRLQSALDKLCANAEDFARKGYNLLIISDKNINKAYAPIPSLLATGAIHQHLVKTGLRCNTAIIVESGDTRETHHLATLIGYGANAVNPYLAFDSIRALAKEAKETHQLQLAISGLETQLPNISAKNYLKACNKGLLKILSKMGVSTLQSYIGSQLFEALGIGEEVMNRCFTGSVSRLGGLNFDDIAAETLTFHRNAFSKVEQNLQDELLPQGGVYQWQKEGEGHLFNPQTIHLLQHSVRNNEYSAYKKYAKLIDNQEKNALTLRGLLQFRTGGVQAIPLEEVEPVSAILKRFSTGAMSFGSLSEEAHSTLAIAMNRIGAKSNSGEGGEDEARYDLLPNGDSARSAVKQIASGRFGVTSWYLVNADELQIKMAQGAKPGEGGQLPGYKVDENIARVRHSTPGVGLISPPPHHDIYSIEDLAQLIFDLKNGNPRARISVKLVSKAGVGIIASGVAKAKADTILISGHDGGTGASPLTSIRHAGLPWELGLAETHQTLVRNRLRNRVRLQTDGQIRTGRDLAVATLLGAEEWGVATAALVAEGCIMMRKCHMNTCPVGIATQDPELRQRFTGKPEHIINFFTFLAEDLREIMASLGFRTVQEMVGKVERLKLSKDLPEGKSRKLDLSALLYKDLSEQKRQMVLPQNPAEKQFSDIGDYTADTANLTESLDFSSWKYHFQDIENEQIIKPVLNSDTLIPGVLDLKLAAYAQLALNDIAPIESEFSIKNTDRSVGTLLSYEISRRWRSEGLPDACISLRFRGSAGQSFGAFGAKGLHFVLEGEANDYFGKGLSGARLIAVPDRLHKFEPSENILIGNVALIGATSGEIFVEGMAGERFAVRNSGAKGVVEGIGDHGCEYMTGGVVVVLGKTGRNFGAGMTGGMAFVYDQFKMFPLHINSETIDLDPMEQPDYELIRSMIRDHFRHTGSAKALAILDNWETQKTNFIKVMPKDYKAILKIKKEAELKKSDKIIQVVS